VRALDAAEAPIIATVFINAQKYQYHDRIVNVLSMTIY